MKFKKLINRRKAPCEKCPYKLGLVETLINPCPQCRQNNYSSYKLFLNHPWQGEDYKNRGK